MTVKELIEALATKPQDAEVRLSTYKDDLVDYFVLRNSQRRDGIHVIILEEAREIQRQ